jgi:hypothetical protein
LEVGVLARKNPVNERTEMCRWGQLRQHLGRLGWDGMKFRHWQHNPHYKAVCLPGSRRVRHRFAMLSLNSAPPPPGGLPKKSVLDQVFASLTL